GLYGRAALDFRPIDAFHEGFEVGPGHPMMMIPKPLFECVLEVACRLKPIGWMFCERLLRNRIEGFWQIRLRFSDGRHWALNDGLQRVVFIFVPEGLLSREGFVEAGAQRKNVSAPIELEPFALLGGEVRELPLDHTGFGFRASVACSRD